MTSVGNINNFLKDQTGVSVTICEHLCTDGFNKLPSIHSCLFKPYRSNTDAFFRAASIATAPIAYSILTVEFLMLTIIEALELIYPFIIGNPDIESDFQPLLKLTVTTSLFAIISPIINLVGLIGSGFTTLMQEKPKQIQTQNQDEYEHNTLEGQTP